MAEETGRKRVFSQTAETEEGKLLFSLLIELNNYSDRETMAMELRYLANRVADGSFFPSLGEE
jgi:hypothetical protein